MIIEPEEIHRFEAAYREFRASRVGMIIKIQQNHGTWRLGPGIKELEQNLPSMLVPCGFEQVLHWADFPRPANLPENTYRDLLRMVPFLRNKSGDWLHPKLPPFDLHAPLFGVPLEDMAALLRGHSISRTDDDNKFIVDGKDVVIHPVPMVSSMEEVIERAWAVAKTPPDTKTLVISPRFWSPGRQRQELDAIQATASAVMTAARSKVLTLEDLAWKQLEELVAYILSERGLKIHLVTESPQGGRDIIARGELIPGFEPLTIAVEVKHRSIVDRPDVQKALWQNRQFPALLFVTSGRFSSGVTDERNQAENRLRLHLWDGITLLRLIEAMI
jgi:hypothetical protein